MSRRPILAILAISSVGLIGYYLLFGGPEWLARVIGIPTVVLLYIAIRSLRRQRN